MNFEIAEEDDAPCEDHPQATCDEIAHCHWQNGACTAEEDDSLPTPPSSEICTERSAVTYAICTAGGVGVYQDSDDCSVAQNVYAPHTHDEEMNFQECANWCYENRPTEVAGTFCCMFWDFDDLTGKSFCQMCTGLTSPQPDNPYQAFSMTCEATTHTEDDPHVTNIEGKNFNVHVQGYVPLLQIQSGEDEMLNIRALIERLDTDPALCGGLGYYYTKLHMKGSWLGQKEILIEKDPQSALDSFVLQIGKDEMKMPMDLKVGTNESANALSNDFLDVSVTSSPDKTSSAVIKLLKSNVKIRIQARIKGLTQRKTSGFLNIFAEGLQKYSHLAKGILGHDDPEQYMDPHANDNCLMFKKSRTQEQTASIARIH